MLPRHSVYGVHHGDTSWMGGHHPRLPKQHCRSIRMAERVYILGGFQTDFARTGRRKASN